MLINRRTFNVKRGHTDEVVALLKAEAERSIRYTHAFRIYTPETGSSEIVAVELEYESLEEYGRLWAEWSATPEAGEFSGEKWYNLTEGGYTNELWWLAE
ncbi:NIPSNAP family protein [Candidatus Bipolaricaulota bacterium]